MEPNHSIKSSFSCNGVSEEKDQQAFANYQRILALLAEASAQPGVEVAFDIKMRVGSPSEHPPLPASPPPELAEAVCDVCGLPCRGGANAQGFCGSCAYEYDNALEKHPEELAEAAAEGGDAVRLLVLRLSAETIRQDEELHEVYYGGAKGPGNMEAFLNEHAEELLERLPASFAPWWKDRWTHEKWCEMAAARKAAGWAFASADAPLVQRLAAMFVAEQHKAQEAGKAHAEELQVVEKRLNGEMEVVMKHKLKEMEAKHADKLANMEKAHKEDLEAVEARHKREMADRNRRYVEALDPLLGVRDKVRDECDKKCHDAERKGYAAGYAFADQKWNPVYMAVCEELAAAQKELSGWAERCVAAQNAAETLRKELKTEVDGATRVFDVMESDLEGLRAEKKTLEAQVAESNHWRGVANQALANANWDKEQLVKSVEALRELVGPTQKLMQSNPELFGGEARGASSPRPPPIIRLKEEVSEEGKQRALNFLKSLVDPSRTCQLVESSPSVLPGIVEAEPSTEGLCMALTEEQYKEMFGADRPPPLPPIVPDEAKVCGTAGCIDCPVAAEPVAGAQPEPVAGAQPEPVAGAQKPIPVCCVDCGKPKPNYNHPNWPSPITKRFAKHLAKHSGLRSPWHSHDPKAIKTHEDALEFIAKRVNISVENLLGWTMKQYQTTYDPWTLVEGPSKFKMGTAPATWWC